MGLLLAHGAAGAGERLGQQGIEVGRVLLKGNLGDTVDKSLEGFVLGYKIGFRVDFDHRTAGSLPGHGHKSLGCHPTGLLGGGGQPFLAQQIDRLLHVAGGFVQRLFTIHHPGAGFGAQVSHHACGNVCHVESPSIVSVGLLSRSGFAVRVETTVKRRPACGPPSFNM
jgi:hypothetical protein